MPLPKIAILNPNATTAMTDEMVDASRLFLGPDVTVEGWTNADGPPAIEGAEDAEASMPGLLALHDVAIAEGCDVVIIGCFDDVGLGVLRQRSSRPVIGLGEASYLVATLSTADFAVVTTVDEAVPVIESNIARMGLSGRCVTVEASQVPVLALHTDKDSASRVATAISGLSQAASGASVVLGCAGMTTIAETVQAQVAHRLVDPVKAAAHLAKAVLLAAPTAAPAPAASRA